MPLVFLICLIVLAVVILGLVLAAGLREKRLGRDRDDVYRRLKDAYTRAVLDHERHPGDASIQREMDRLDHELSLFSRSIFRRRRQKNFLGR